jgi:outer membrane protein TolC
MFGASGTARADEPTVLSFAAAPLAQAEQLAVDESPDVESARAAVDAAAAALAVARGTSGVTALIGYTELPQGSGVPNIIWSQRLTAYEVQATLGDVIALSPLAAQAAASLRGSMTDELTAERSERLKVIGLYFAAIQARADLLAKRDAVGRARDFEDELSARFGEVKVPYLDLLRAEVALSKARSDVAVAQGVDANASDALAREIGMSTANLHGTVEITAAEAEVIDADRALARAMAQRPELRSAEQNVKAAQAGLAAAHRAVLPPITVAGGYVTGIDANEPSHGGAVSASIQIPLAGIAAARIAAQQAAVRAAKAKEQSVRRALAIEVRAAAHTAAAAIIARDETDSTLEAARSTVTFATMEYAARKTSGLSVSDAQAIYDQAVIDDIAAQYAVQQAQATLDVELSP